uniref:Uncharacterized protein n=1 Tax=Spongospora subterranea TaxID=70186 RepID=A0A0H5QU78_9EUKA|eukprot:CRZ05568.1 hypothetical protein [Spongospora subterranea]
MFSCLITSDSFLERSVLLQKDLAFGRNIASVVSSEERSNFVPADLDLFGVPLVLSFARLWITPFRIDMTLNLRSLPIFFSDLVNYYPDWNPQAKNFMGPCYNS